MALSHPPLEGAEFSLVHFILRLREASLLTPQLLLGMRMGLKNAARRLGGTAFDTYGELIDPAVPVDPWSDHPSRKPAPGFAFSPPSDLPREVGAGKFATLSFRFWGRGIQDLPAFAAVLKELGNQGIEKGLLRFDLERVEAEDLACSCAPIWKQGEDFAAMAPPIIPVKWWLEEFPFSHERLTLRFNTPARLVSHGKPLFRPGFGDIFPFMLRRVTSMLQYYCGFNRAIDGPGLVALASDLVALEDSLAWQDWKSIGGHAGLGSLGGVVGTLVVTGEGVQELLWIVALGSLLNIGKGAAFGAGSYSLG